MPSSYVPHPTSTAAVTGHAIHTILTSFPIACFTLALMADIIYWRTSHLMWLEFSAWLLLAGIVIGVAAAIFGAVYILTRFGTRAMKFGWPSVIGTLIVLTLAFFNNLVHAADGWTAVMPWGLTLSALTVLVMLITVWLGASFVHTPGVGVRTYD